MNNPIGVLATSLLALTLSSTSVQAQTTRSMVVDRPGMEDHALQSMWASLNSRGVDHQLAARALRGLDGYVGQRLGDGLTVRLFPVAIVDVVHAASVKGWSAPRIAWLLVELQKQVDGGTANPVALYYLALADVAAGREEGQVAQGNGPRPRQ